MKRIVAEGTNLISVFVLGAPAYPLLPFQVVAKICDKYSSVKCYLVFIWHIESSFFILATYGYWYKHPLLYSFLVVHSYFDQEIRKITVSKDVVLNSTIHKQSLVGYRAGVLKNFPKFKGKRLRWIFGNFKGNLFKRNLQMTFSEDFE